MTLLNSNLKSKGLTPRASIEGPDGVFREEDINRLALFLSHTTSILSTTYLTKVKL